MLGVGTSAPWKESNNGSGLLEWFAWSEAVEITIRVDICIQIAAPACYHMHNEIYSMLAPLKFCRGIDIILAALTREYCYDSEITRGLNLILFFSLIFHDNLRGKVDKFSLYRPIHFGQEHTDVNVC